VRDKPLPIDLPGRSRSGLRAEPLCATRYSNHHVGEPQIARRRRQDCNARALGPAFGGLKLPMVQAAQAGTSVTAALTVKSVEQLVGSGPRFAYAVKAGTGAFFSGPQRVACERVAAAPS